jgi:hypothetical protein
MAQEAFTHEKFSAWCDAMGVKEAAKAKALQQALVSWRGFM